MIDIGAGDSFNGAIIYSFLHGFSTAKMLKFASYLIAFVSLAS